MALIGIHSLARRAIKNGTKTQNGAGTETRNGAGMETQNSVGTETRNGMRMLGIVVVVQNNHSTCTERELFIDWYCTSSL